MFIVVAILIGLIPAAIAAKKGRNFLLWWLYGAALFIVALPHALLASDKTRRPCPHCAEPVRHDANVCPHCRTSLFTPSSAAPVVGPLRETASGARRCTACSASMNSREKFCSNCGQDNSASIAGR